MFKDLEASPWEIIRTPAFWAVWALFFIGAGAGLMVIGSVAGMAKGSMGERAFLAVAILAVGNAGGRIAAGMLSDRIGRKRTLAAVFSFQAALMFMAIPVVGAEQASGLLLVISSSVAHDLYYRIINPKATEGQRLLVGRMVIGLAVVIAGLLGIFPPGFVSQVVAFAFGLAAASFFPAIILGILTKVFFQVLQLYQSSYRPIKLGDET